MEILGAISNILMALSKILEEYAELKKQQLIRDAENATSDNDKLAVDAAIAERLRHPS